MKFELTAVIKEIGPIESFGSNGFQKRNLILTEQSGEYENLVCIEFSGDKIDRPDCHQVGQQVTVSGFINCREYEGRYFTSLRGSFIQNVGGQQQQQPVPNNVPTQAPQPQYNQAPPQAPPMPQQQPVAQQPVAQPQQPVHPYPPQMAPAPNPQQGYTQPQQSVQQNNVNDDIPFNS